jgi:tyrosyl-tRNA synthetase
MDKINEILTRGVENTIPSKEKLRELLSSGKKLNIYFGIDPTATKIHLGHTIPLRKLQAFADLGHNVSFLIGDFTALIGDTSDKDTERPILTSDQIKENFKTYKKQAEKILDFSKIKVVYNSEWLSKLTFMETVRLCQHFSFGDFASRELIRNRLQSSKRVGLHEALYPVMQGYDSYYLDTDIQIGGTDQTFNMQAGRTLQKDLRGKESFIIASSFLMGTDGRKMSKSWGNAIWIEDSPNEIFGKIMSIDDSQIVPYFTLATNTPQEKIKLEKNPMISKLKLAETIVSELYSQKEAISAKKYFQRTFQQKKPDYQDTIPLANTLAKAISIKVGSMSEAKRLITSGGVDVNSKTITDPKSKIKVGDKIKIGKNLFFTVDKQ